MKTAIYVLLLAGLTAYGFAAASVGIDVVVHRQWPNGGWWESRRRFAEHILYGLLRFKRGRVQQLLSASIAFLFGVLLSSFCLLAIADTLM